MSKQKEAKVNGEGEICIRCLSVIGKEGGATYVPNGNIWGHPISKWKSVVSNQCFLALIKRVEALEKRLEGTIL